MLCYATQSKTVAHGLEGKKTLFLKYICQNSKNLVCEERFMRNKNDTPLQVDIVPGNVQTEKIKDCNQSVLLEKSSCQCLVLSQCNILYVYS